MNTQRKRETDNELRKREMEKRQKQEELKQQREWIEDYKARYGKALEIYENLVNNLPSWLLTPYDAKCELTKGATTASLAGVGAIVAAAAATGLAPELLVVGTVGLGVQYFMLNSVQQARAAAVQRLELEASNLKRMLEELSGEAQSIVSAK